MWPSPGTRYGEPLMAIVDQWDGSAGAHKDNTEKLFWLVVFKAAMDTMLAYVCVLGWRKSFLGLCGVSVLLIDWTTAVLMAGSCFLRHGGSIPSPCTILAIASSTYAALPLPALCFGVLDYCLDDSCLGSRRPLCKLLRNYALLVLAWMQATYDGMTSVGKELLHMEGEAGERFLLCPLEMMPLVNVAAFFLTFAVLVALLPFRSRIVPWVREAERLADERLARDQSVGEHELFLPDPSEKRPSCTDERRQGAGQPGPPLWVSLTLAFAGFWMPYLVLSVLIHLCDLRVPAFVIVNLLWLECSRSALEGLVFWARSRKSGPYCDMPDNICPWQVYWRLSREARLQHFSTDVLSQFTGEKNAALFV